MPVFSLTATDLPATPKTPEPIRFPEFGRTAPYTLLIQKDGTTDMNRLLNACDSPNERSVFLKARPYVDGSSSTEGMLSEEAVHAFKLLLEKKINKELAEWKLSVAGLFSSRDEYDAYDARNWKPGTTTRHYPENRDLIEDAFAISDILETPLGNKYFPIVNPKQGIWDDRKPIGFAPDESQRISRAELLRIDIAKESEYVIETPVLQELVFPEVEPEQSSPEWLNVMFKTGKMDPPRGDNEDVARDNDMETGKLRAIRVGNSVFKVQYKTKKQLVDDETPWVVSPIRPECGRWSSDSEDVDMEIDDVSVRDVFDEEYF